MTAESKKLSVESRKHGRLMDERKMPDEWNVRKKVIEMAGGIKKHEFVMSQQTRMLIKLFELREKGIEPENFFH